MNPRPIMIEHAVQIPPLGLCGLVVPEPAMGMILFAHGSASSRHSPRNRQVAETLQYAGFGTLLLDLLTAAEEEIDAVRATSVLTFRFSPIVC